MDATWWLSDEDLDADQAAAVQGVDENASFLLRGPAGSGKTNILLLRAKWLRIKGKSNFKIVVFTRTLRDFLRAGCEAYGIPRESVVTSTQLLRDLLQEHSVSYAPADNFEADRLLLAGKAQALIEEKKIKNAYEALFIDECQDYIDTELLIFRELAQRLYLATDSRQSIYQSTQTQGLLEKLVDGRVVELKYHYRSGIKICRVADSIIKDSAYFVPIEESSHYNEGLKPSSVNLFPFATIDGQFEAIIKKLPEQLDGYPDEQIGVLMPKKELVSAFRDEFSRHDFGEDAERVLIDTMHGAKGLEFRAVHLAGCETLYKMGATQKRLIYTAILRARTAVAIYYTGNVPGYLESAVAKLSPPRAAPALSDLFKKTS